MDLERLSEFAQAARCGSMKKLSEETGVPQATLAARLRSFENELGVELFRRSPSGTVLTQAGERLLPSAEEILEDLRQLRYELREAERHRYRRLRIAVTGSGLPLYLGPFLDELNLRYPDMSLELFDDTRFSIEDGLRSGAVDIYFAPVMSEFEIPGLTKTTVAASSQYVLMSRSHRLAYRNTVSLKELDGESFVLYPRTKESSIRDFQFCNLKASGITYKVYESETSPLFYKLLVPIGKGLILSPRDMMDLPPNTVCVSVTDVPHPAAPCFFYERALLNEETEAVVRDYVIFAKEAHRREHRAAL